MDPEWKRCRPHCDQQLQTSQRDESNSAVSHCFNGPFTAQALSTRPLVLSRLVLGTTRNETVVSEWGKKKDLNCYYRCSCTHTRTHAQYTGRFTKGNPLREMPDFGHSDHFFIYGSPLFLSPRFCSCLWITCDQIPVNHRTDRRRPTEPHVWKKTSLWLLLFCMRQGSTRGRERGSKRPHLPPR